MISLSVLKTLLYCVSLQTFADSPASTPGPVLHRLGSVLLGYFRCATSVIAIPKTHCGLISHGSYLRRCDGIGVHRLRMCRISFWLHSIPSCLAGCCQLCVCVSCCFWLPYSFHSRKLVRCLCLYPKFLCFGNYTVYEVGHFFSVVLG